jgi:hypothetical protein
MATAAPSPAVLPMRQPLGLPAGSVRALLALMVFGTIWAILLLPEVRPDVQPVAIPLYLYYLMFLILGHYFGMRAHHALTVPRPSPPLHLPRGSLRILFIIGFAAVLGWGFYHDPEFAKHLVPAASEQPYLIAVVLGAFFVGIIVGRIGNRFFVGPGGVSPWFQDVLAWVSLLAMLGLGIDFMIHLFINPTLPAARQLDHPFWEGLLASIVAFYFGVRS